MSNSWNMMLRVGGPRWIFLTLSVVVWSIGVPVCSKIICDMETYVLTGIEFTKCYDTTLSSYDIKNPNYNPCPALYHSVYGCSEILEPCFDHRAWHRSRQVFMEIMALQYPEHSHCDVFSNKSRAEPVPQKLEFEMCSIDDEVVMLQQIRTCNNNEQSNLVSNLVKPAKPDLSKSDGEDQLYFPTICKNLQQLSDNCFQSKLVSCFSPSEVEFYMAYLLEDLRMTATSLMTHLMVQVGGPSGSNSSSNQMMSSVVDLEDCPVFKNSPLMKQRSTKPSARVKILVIILVVVFVANIVAFLAYLARKFRIMPRLRARLERQPYRDIVILGPPNSQPQSSKPEPAMTQEVVAMENSSSPPSGLSA